MTDIDTLIVGGGLSGVYAAWLLSRENKSFILLEARDRIGGRIQCPKHDNFSTDLGPSWFWPAFNPRISRLVKEMGLDAYPQYESGLGRFQMPDGTPRTISGYPMEPEAWRISGGMIALVDRFFNNLPRDAVRLNHPVCEIQKRETGIRVGVGELEQEERTWFKARKVILALPPRLAAASILFTPDLSPALTQAILKTKTWMAGHAKFFALYPSPHWRQAGLSGQAFSQYGPLGEIHDGSNREPNAPYGLTGFVSVPAAQRREPKALKQAILAQLDLMFGSPAGHPQVFYLKDWAQERFTATEFDQRGPHEHPLFNPPDGKNSIWDNQVLLAGTETDDQLGGYLEGALASAERAVKEGMQCFNRI